MKTKLWTIFLVLFCTLLTSGAQIFYKFGVKKLSFNFFSLITNYYLIFGLILYLLGAILLIIALKNGELSVLYPIVATSYIWVSLLSPKFFPTDSINLMKWIGVFIIVTGVSFVGIGGRNGN